jgi:hypothetical protein
MSEKMKSKSMFPPTIMVNEYIYFEEMLLGDLVLAHVVGAALLACTGPPVHVSTV